MTPHEWDVLALVLSVAALVTCVRLGWVWGRARLREEYECDGGLMDQTYDEGSDDQWQRMTTTGVMTAADAPTISLTVPVSGAEPAGRSGTAPAVNSGLSDDRFPSSGQEPHGGADWLTATHEQLSPEHIQDLPGPDPSSTASRAGGLQWWEEAPLPAVLGLGQEFSGDDKTYARWQVRRWEFRRQCGLDSIEAA